VRELAEGDRVTIEPIYRCGECLPCRSGRYNTCTRIGFHGLSTDGGMAELTVVDERMAYKPPDEVSNELGALVEPMSFAYHAAKLGNVDGDGIALVFGAGPIGIGLWFALRGQGARSSFSPRIRNSAGPCPAPAHSPRRRRRVRSEQPGVAIRS
jgi:(R,R)-butanediol dehydrogenase/meso-butanediol dehydrogenase/diacetyl reductase